MLTVAERAWVAGFLDGEGYIGVQQKRERNRFRTDPDRVRGVTRPFDRKATYKLTVQVSQRNRAPLEFLVGLFGGAVTRHSVAKQPGTVYSQWIVSGARALSVIDTVLPYLINKRHVAEIASEFGHWYISSRASCGRQMSDERRNKAENYWRAIQEINRTYRTVVPQQVLPKLVVNQ